MKSRNAMREAELWVWLYARVNAAGELNRKGHVIAAMEDVALVELLAAELKALLAERAGVNE